MKTNPLLLLTLSSLLPLPLLAQGPVQSTPLVSTPFAITQKAANSRVWERTVIEPGSRGKSFARKHTFTELQTGLNYFTGSDWVPSVESIEIQPDGGALAQQGQHRVYFPGSLYSDALRITTPDSKELVTRPLGLCFADDQRSVLIAELRNGPTGQLLPSGSQVLWTNICETCRLDLLVTYRKASVESDLVIREQLPNVADYGFSDSSKVVIQWWTEFFNPPEPQQTERILADGSSDSFLDFGQMRMPEGKAYLSGIEGQPQIQIPVRKAWKTIQNRVFLIETIPLAAVIDQLGNLPPRSAAIRSPGSPVFAKSKPNLKLPQARSPVHTSRPIQIAKSDYRPELGFTTDYVLLNSGETNYVFRSDDTFEISGNTILSGSNTVFEPGTVLKFDPGAMLTITTPVSWLGRDYQPVSMVAFDENGVGEALPGSTGTPGNAYYADTALNFDAVTAATNLTLQNLRVSNARTAIAINGRSGHVLSDVQLVNCMNGLALTNAQVSLRNALFSQVLTNFTGSSSTGRVEHLTSDTAIWLNSDIGLNLFLTNSLLVAVTNLGNYTTLQNVSRETTGLGVFAAAGGASHFLIIGSTNRQAGTTNISPALLASLKHKTTYPPVVYSNVTISVDTTFAPQAQRGTSIPDIGWSYAPLDYVFGGAEGAANMTFSPGTAVGWFRDSFDGDYHGLHLHDGQTATFNGTAQSPAYWVRTTTVQEGSTQDWDGPWGPGGITGSAWPDFSQSAKVILRFTRCSILANDNMHFRDDYGYLTVQATHCEFWSGSLGGYASLLTFTNCLMDRATIWISWDGVPDTGCSLILQNCLMHRGNFYPYRQAAGPTYPYYPLWSIHDTAFDSISLNEYDNAAGDPSVTAIDYNAFMTNADRIAPAGSNDVIVTNFTWLAGPLGSYYQPTNSPLINHGSTNANLLGLYHYTVTTNLVAGLQIKETNSIVDISYHYVAVDSNGSPLDSDRDGIPDYLDDSNGNGIYDAGDLANWNAFDTDGDGISDGDEVLLHLDPLVPDSAIPPGPLVIQRCPQ